MELKYETLNNPSFVAAFSRLVNAQLPPKIAYKIMRIHNCVTSEMKTIETLWRRLLDQYAEKDEKGNPLREERGFKMKEESGPLYEKAFQELMSITCTIPWDAIPLSDIASVELSAVELKAIELFVSFNEAEARPN